MVTLATPYYGSMTRPHGRPEHIFIKLIANPKTGEFNQAELCVWDSRKMPDLPDWLSMQGIETILCNDSPIGSEQPFSSAGVTIFCKQEGEVQDMVHNWTAQIKANGRALAA